MNRWLRSPFVRRFVLPVLAAVAGAATAVRPTGMRLDVTVLTLSFVGGWVCALAAGIAGVEIGRASC